MIPLRVAALFQNINPLSLTANVYSEIIFPKMVLHLKSLATLVIIQFKFTTI